jgi:hypothetical protein
MLQAMSALARPVLVAATVAALVVLAGCGGGGGATRSSATSSSSTAAVSARSTTTRAAARHRHRRRRSRVPPGAVPVGRGQRVHAGTSILTVTVTRIYNSLADTGSALLPGTHAAGVQLSIRTDSGETYDSTASGDVSVITSSGSAAPLFIKQGVCQTPLTDFESLIGVGETHAGCVGFTVPHGARVVAVRFSPHSRAPGSVTWR